MTAMIFESLEYDKAIMVMYNTYFLYSIYLIVGFFISTILIKFYIKKNNI